MIHDDAVAAVGGTPLVRLSRLHPAGNLVAKLEYMNPAGSVKERIAVQMINVAEEQGLLKPGGTIVEPTSGNTGAGLAMVGAVRGYRVICTLPDKVSPEKIDLLRAYGVEVHVTPTDLLPDHPDSYYGLARRFTEEIDGAFNPNQYANQANPEAHYLTTGPEDLGADRRGPSPCSSRASAPAAPSLASGDTSKSKQPVRRNRRC